MFQNSVSTREPCISLKPRQTSLYFIKSRNSLYGCFLPINICGAGRLILYSLKFLSFHDFSFNISGVICDISSPVTFSLANCPFIFSPSAVILYVYVSFSLNLKKLLCNWISMAFLIVSTWVLSNAFSLISFFSLN